MMLLDVSWKGGPLMDFSACRRQPSCAFSAFQNGFWAAQILGILPEFNIFCGPDGRWGAFAEGMLGLFSILKLNWLWSLPTAGARA